MFLFTGGAVVAQDTLAGEKERGTLETLLTTAASRREIVAAKLLLVLTVAVAITTIQVGNLLVYARLQLIPSAAQLADVMTPSLAAGLLLFLLPLAALISAALLLVSGYAKSYREAQFNFMPILLLSAMPALAATLPGISLRSAIVVVPIANISVGVRELLIGRIDLPFLHRGVAGHRGRRRVDRADDRTRALQRTADRARRSANIARGTAARIAHGGQRLLVVCRHVGGVAAGLAEPGPERRHPRAGRSSICVGIFLTGSFLFLRRYRLPARDMLLLNRPRLAGLDCRGGRRPGGARDGSRRRAAGEPGGAGPARSARELRPVSRCPTTSASGSSCRC